MKIFSKFFLLVIIVLIIGSCHAKVIKRDYTKGNICAFYRGDATWASDSQWQRYGRHGGNGGGPFSQSFGTCSATKGCYKEFMSKATTEFPNYYIYNDAGCSQKCLTLDKVTWRQGKYIERLQFIMKDGFTFDSHTSQNAPADKTWNIPDGQYITKISIWSGKWVDGLEFETNKGVRSPHMGGSGGGRKDIRVDYPGSGERFISFTGRRGALIDQISFITVAACEGTSWSF